MSIITSAKDLIPSAIGQASNIVWTVDELFENAIGSQAIADSAELVREIEIAGKNVGRVYRDREAEYCLLAGVMPGDVGATRERQARSCFERIERALAQAGMNCGQIVRTWLYLDRLLEWYDEFNGVRNQFFRERGILGRVIPASTGIGLANSAGAALVGGVMAIKPKTDAVKVCAVPSPMQCAAVDYRSAFSRAMEVLRAEGRQLFVSGTASIGPDGTSAHRDDPGAQIELTMKVVEAILRSRGMGWADTTRMIAYFKDIRHVGLFEEWCERKRAWNLPAVFVQADVCRDELLFEVEMDAVRAA